MPSFMKVIYDLANLPCKRFLVPHGHDFIDLLGKNFFNHTRHLFDEKKLCVGYYYHCELSLLYICQISISVSKISMLIVEQGNFSLCRQILSGRRNK